MGDPETRRILLPPLLQYQADALCSTDALLLFRGGIGCGKTRCLGMMVLRGASEQEGCESAIFAPSYTLLRRVTLPSIQAVVPPELYRWNPGDKCIEWINGSITYCLGVDRTPEQRIIGMNLGWAVWDEAGASPNGRIIGLIEQRLRAGDPGLRFLALFTSPHGYGWLRDWEERNHPRVIHATTYDNTYLDPSYIAMLEEEFPPGSLLHRQEMLGEYVVRSGLVYPMFSRAVHLCDERFDPDRPYELGWDPGFRAAGVIAFQEFGREHVAVKEWTPDNEFTDDTARRIDDELGFAPAAVRLDTPSKLNTRTGITDVQALRAVWPRCDVRVLGGKKRSSDYRHRALSGALHRRNFKVSRDLEPRGSSQADRGIVRALESLAWPREEPRDESPPKKDPFKHVVDAAEFYAAVKLPPQYTDSAERQEAT